jgi:hypothetical protein
MSTSSFPWCSVPLLEKERAKRRKRGAKSLLNCLGKKRELERVTIMEA